MCSCRFVRWYAFLACVHFYYYYYCTATDNNHKKSAFFYTHWAMFVTTVTKLRDTKTGTISRVTHAGVVSKDTDISRCTVTK
jgi:hypothetical protein